MLLKRTHITYKFNIFLTSAAGLNSFLSTFSLDATGLVSSGAPIVSADACVTLVTTTLTESVTDTFFLSAVFFVFLQFPLLSFFGLSDFFTTVATGESCTDVFTGDCTFGLSSSSSANEGVSPGKAVTVGATVAVAGSVFRPGLATVSDASIKGLRGLTQVTVHVVTGAIDEMFDETFEGPGRGDPGFDLSAFTKLWKDKTRHYETVYVAVIACVST